MDDGRRKEVTRLLKRGLNHYGLGDLDAAIHCWEQARALDPENQAVHDYLETAYEEAGRQPGGGAANAPAASIDPMDDDATPRSLENVHGLEDSGNDHVQLPFEEPDDPDTLVGEALEKYKSGDLDGAWDALERAAGDDPNRLDVKGYMQLIRTERAQVWAKEIGDQGRNLRIDRTTQQIMQLKLQPDEGFLLSQIDGKTTIADLINVSTSDRVRTLEILAKLIREDIVA